MTMISVLLVTRGGKRTIERCLAQLVNQTIPTYQYEIIVVQNGKNNNDSLEKKFTSVRFFRSETMNDPDAFNCGLEKARGKYIAFTHNDCYVDKDWLRRLVDFMDLHPELAAAGGPIRLVKGNSIMERLIENGYDDIQQKNISGINRVIPFLIHANAVYRKEVFHRVGFFDARFIEEYDVDLSFRLFLHRFQIGYCPDAVLYHDIYRTIWQSILQLYRIASIEPILKRKYHTVYKGLYQRPSIDSLLPFGDKQKIKFSGYQWLYSLGWFIVSWIAIAVQELRLRLFSISIQEVLKENWPERIEFNRTKYRIDQELIWTQQAGRIRLVQLKNGISFTLDGIGRDIWNYLTGPGNRQKSLVEWIQSNYMAPDPTEVTQDILDFLTVLKNEHLIHVDHG